MPEIKEGEKVEWVRMEVATNGWIVEYTLMTPKVGGGTFDNMVHHDKQIIFDEENDPDAGDKAFATYRALMEKKREQMNAPSSVDRPKSVVKIG